MCIKVKSFYLVSWLVIKVKFLFSFIIIGSVSLITLINAALEFETTLQDK